MSAVREVDLATVRRLNVALQGLAGTPPRSSPARVLDVVRRIRCVQLDPISVVARSPFLVLRSRLRDFAPGHLDRLVYRDRALFEYWAHAASIVLTEDYPIHHYRMREASHGSSTAWGERIRTWMHANDRLRRSVLSNLRRHGPLRLRDLVDESLVAWQSSGWSRERNVDQMLRLLWTRGRVMVADRKGLEKWWDLAERVIPPEVRRRRLSDLGVSRRAAELSLRGLGVATPQHVKDHFTIGRYPELPRALEGLERARSIERVRLVDDGSALPGTWFVHRDDLPVLEALEAGAWEPRATLLSPFDNVIHDRKRAERVFGLRYRMEIYVPKDQRRFGYYAMPLLVGDRFLARVDAANDRTGGRLLVHAVHPEPGVRPDRVNAEHVRGSIHELAAWVGASRIDATGRLPRGWGRALG
ncbi:MAG: winged helix-turn-helix domain-containing protein [Actinomycetota bacterium]